MKIPHLTLEQAQELLQGDYVMLQLEHTWGDYFYGTYDPLALRQSDLPKEGVGYLHIRLETDYHVGLIIAPTEIALLYILSIPGTEIIDLNKINVRIADILDGGEIFARYGWLEYIKDYLKGYL